MSHIPIAISPSWIKVTKTFTNFSAAAVTNTIVIYSLPAKYCLHSVMLNATTKFSGGLIATYTISVGIAGNATKYSAATNVFTGATLPSPSVIAGVESMSGPTDIKATAISTIGNLNAAVAGSVDIYLLVSKLEF